MNKEQIRALNILASKDFEGADELLRAYNEIHKTNYTWLNKRVSLFMQTVYDDRPEWHDAFTWAE